jgi:lysine 2,3-aminomutase
MEGIANYLRAHPEIEEVILSGGDPLYTPQLTTQVLEVIEGIASVKVLRIGTRLPLQLPAALERPALRSLLERVDEMGRSRPFYVLLHIAHPAELTPESVRAIQQLRHLKVTLLSQTVFLKGINDDFETLLALFRQLHHLGVMPYYLYRCDAVKGLERFVCDLQTERTIARRLREALGGIACPLHVEDMENGYGKWPL